MNYFWHYHTPEQFDDLTMISDGTSLTSILFDINRTNNNIIPIKQQINYYLPIFQETCHWLDLYFSGQNPNFTPKYNTNNLTYFRQEVQNLLIKIPYGKTTTYGILADEIAKNRGIKKMSARAVGGAVGWNPICIIIPCHRVVGKNNRMTGYGCGIKNKIALLKHENVTQIKHVL